MLSRRTLICVATMLGFVAATTTSATVAHAGPAVATCALTGTATFTPDDQLPPQSNVTVDISGSGFCEGGGVQLGQSVSILFGGTMPLTDCAVGEGNMFGSVTFGGVNPPDYAGPATFVGAPAAATLTIAGVPLDAVATLPWSNPSAIAACPSSGTASTALTGTFTFVAT